MMTGEHGRTIDRAWMLDKASTSSKHLIPTQKATGYTVIERETEQQDNTKRN